MEQKIRIAVVGAGTFGRHHLRVIRESGEAELAAVVDADPERARQAAEEFSCTALSNPEELQGKTDCAVVAVPTTRHVEVGCRLLDLGIDVMVEKPIAPDMESARRLVEAARAGGRILQVGHLERFNPAVTALRKILTVPLFFEIHRLSVFTPRSLDVDVVLDLMIHDLDVVLALTGKQPDEIRASGISILTEKVDIANVRLAFPGGTVANLTASRISTERVRKMRLFQPHQYVSLDYTRQEAAVFAVGAERQIRFEPLKVEHQEPLRLQLSAFLHSVATRVRPEVDGEAALGVLEVSLAILDKIEEHARLVAPAIRGV